jgi:hypothetical protein
VPLPAPAFVTVNAWLTLSSVKLAITDCAAVIVTVQVPVPEQTPLQPVKVEPAAGAAVRVTAWPAE